MTGIVREKDRVVARKLHRCSECGAKIEPGDMHASAVLLEKDEGWKTMKRCARCAVTAKMVLMRSGERPPWGTLGVLADAAGIEFPVEVWIPELDDNGDYA